jgi:hypothetical protein
MINTPDADPFFCLRPGKMCAKIKGVPSQIGFRFQNDLSKLNSEGFLGDLSPHKITHLPHEKQDFHSKTTPLPTGKNHPRKKNTLNPADLQF